MHEITFIPVGIYLLKVNNRNTSIKFEISKLIKSPDRRHWHHSDVFIVDFKYISQLLVFLLLSSTMQLPKKISK